MFKSTPSTGAPSGASEEVDRLVSTEEAGALLGISPRTLEDWRLRGGGPVFRKLGRRVVRYLVSDLRAFIEDAARANTGCTAAPA